MLSFNKKIEKFNSLEMNYWLKIDRSDNLSMKNSKSLKTLS